MFIAAVEENGLSRSIPVLSVLDGDNRNDRLSGDFSVRWENLSSAVEQLGALWSEEIPRSLLNRVIQEAEQSNLLAGESAEEWSPLGRVTVGQAARLNAQINSADDLDATLRNQRSDDSDSPATNEEDDRPPRAVLAVRVVGVGQAMITMSVDPRAERDDEPPTAAALIFSADAFIVPIPSRTGSMYFEYRPDQGEQATQLAHAEAALSAFLPDGEITHFVLWRAYFGTNTTVIDGVAELSRLTRRLSMPAFRMGGWLVGRVGIAVHRRKDRHRRDPFAQDRLLKAESAPHLAELLMACPRFDKADLLRDARLGVIAVHGTMSTAVPMAAALSPRLPAGRPLLRYEHDTWLPVGVNARELASLIEQSGTRRVLLVAHSRGGLVARQARDVLRGKDYDIRLLTLGTPFLGTPIVSAARGTLFAFVTLMGALRIVPGTGPVIDAGTRLAGLLFKGGLPNGLLAMDPAGTYLDAYVPQPLEQAWTFGGHVDPHQAQDNYGLAALQGFAAAAFNGDANDLVVGKASAQPLGSTAEDLECDHFSYLIQQPVLDRLKELVLPRRPVIRRPPSPPGPK